MVPLAVSIVSDSLPVERRSRAMALFFAGGPIGSLAVLLFGGLLLKHLGRHPVSMPLVGVVQPWQTLFLLLAVPGILLCTLILFVMKDPARPSAKAAHRDGSAQRGDILAFLRGHRSLIAALFAGYPLLQMPGIAVAAWAFLYFDRVYGMPLERAAVAFSVTAGITSIFGCLLSGRFVLMLRKRGYVDASLRACLLGGVFFAIFAVCGLLAPSPRTALLFFSVAFFFSYVPTVGAYSAISEIAPPAIRASVAGLNALTSGVVATSLGPYLVGVFSDYLFPGARLGIRWALLTTMVISVLCGLALVAPGLRALRDRIKCINEAAEVQSSTEEPTLSQS